MPNRRLSDKIVAAHAQACDQEKAEIADMLMRTLEIDLSAIGGSQMDRRDATEVLEGAFERHARIKANA
jgi:hypothetical protein